MYDWVIASRMRDERVSASLAEKREARKAARQHAKSVAEIIDSLLRSYERERIEFKLGSDAWHQSWRARLEIIDGLATSALSALDVSDTSEACCKLYLARGDLRALITRLTGDAHGCDK